MKPGFFLGVVLFFLPVEPGAAAPFTAGNLVIYRVGTGAASLLSSATPGFLDEYSPSGTLVQSIPLPVAVSGANLRLTTSGTASTEGFLQRSADRRFLTLTGYDADVGTAGVAGTASATVKRTVAFVDAAGSVDTTTSTTAFNTQNPRSAVSDDGSGVWVCGGSSGVVYLTRGGSGAGTGISSTSTNNRCLDIHGGQLVVSSGSGSLRLGAVGTGLPKVSGNSTVPLPGIPTTAGSPYQFMLFDLSSAVAGLDTLYVADETAGTGGVQKFALTDGSWSARGNVPGTGELTSLRGLTGTASGSSVTLYANNTIRLVTLTDTSGYGGTLTGSFTVLANAAANTAFRGLDFAPTAALPAAPALSIAAGAGAVVVTWPAPSTGWVLQENTALTSGIWANSSGVVDDGGVRRLTVSGASGRRFFRLALP